MTRSWVQADPKRLEQVIQMRQYASELTKLTGQLSRHLQSITETLLAICGEVGDYGRISSPDIYMVSADDTRTAIYLALCETIHYIGQMEKSYLDVSKLAGEDPYCWLLFGDLQIIVATKKLFVELLIKLGPDIHDFYSVCSNLGNRAWSPAHIEALVQMSQNYLRPSQVMSSISKDFQVLTDDYQKVTDSEV
jgi:hypothetical protein